MNGLIFLLSALAIIAFYYIWIFNYWKRQGVKTLRPNLLFGNLLGVVLRKVPVYGMFKKVYAACKNNGDKFMGFYILNIPVLVIVDHELIKRIFTSDFNHFTDREFYLNEKDPLTIHIGAAKGDQWRKMRQQFSPAFSPSKLKNVCQTLFQVGDHLKAVLDKSADTYEVVNLKEVCGRYMTDAIGMSIFGIECNTLQNLNLDFKKCAENTLGGNFTQNVKLALSMLCPSVLQFLKIPFNNSEVEKFYLNMVRSTVEYREKNNVVRNDLMHSIIQLRNNIDIENENDLNLGNVSENEKSLKIEEITAQALVFFGAAYETSSSTISLCIYELASNADIQNNLRKEIASVLGKHGGNLSYDVIMEMTYLEKCVTETLRKYALAPIMSRVCTKKYKLPDTDIVLDVGTTIYLPIYEIHQDPVYYPNPEKFDPERFSPENKLTRPSYTFLAFGEGPRNCIALLLEFSAMFSICKQTHPATGIEHAISCNFYSKAEKNLVTAATNILKVFRLIPDVEPKFRSDRYSDSRPPKSKLECVGQYTLFGNVTSLQSVNLANSPRDALLIAFSDAKLSVVEYDSENHDLKTLSLHYFEEDDMKEGWTHHHHVPIVRTDPENRCAVMSVFGRKLVVLPFRRENSIDDGDLAELKPMASSSSGSRAPILASYMIILKEVMDKIDDVIDIQFLHGYHEPTLLILYEPLKTFSGRVAVRTDTCAMAVISLNLQQKVHPVIWQVTNLPFDCIRAVPIKKPLGGTLVMSVNALICLNQSIPPYGVSLNSISESSTNFPFKPQDDIKISLDCAQVGFLADDQLVLSLKDGELYVLTLLADSMGYVRNFHFDKAASSVLTTCVCVCEDNFLFLGSRLGNSLLLKFTEKHNQVITLEEDDPPAKRPRMALDSLNDCMATDVLDIRDPEEFEVYGNVKQASLQFTGYIFEVCDSLLNIGPCGNLAVGEPANNVDFDLELVTTSGYGKNGALSVLQYSIKPQIVTTFTLPGCINMWTVCKSDDKDAFLLLSQKDGTKILQTGQEINEIDNTGFSTNGPTVYVTNLGDNKYIVQVTTAGIRLLYGITQLQHIPLDVGSPIVHASSADPYISMLAANGQVITMMLREGKGSARLVVSKSTLANTPAVTTLCMYRDVSGLFSNKIPDDFTHIPEAFVKESESKVEAENEDDLLYGDESDFKMPTLNPPSTKPKSAFNWWKKYLVDYKPTYWLFIVRENSNLEIYSVPEFKLTFIIRNLCFGHKVLVDSLESVPLLATDTTQVMNEINIQKEFGVKEILMAPLGNHGSRPLLLVRLENDLHVYEVFRFSRGNLKLRFRKMKHNIIYSPNVGVKVETENSEFFTLQERVPRMRYFNNIAGYNGVFISGATPYWLLLTSRGELRTHVMTIDSEILCFTSFNNVNCPQGFLYFNRKAELRIGVLPTHLSYDSPWPVRKVPLRCTPHFVQYHSESKTYCIVTSIAEPSKQYYKFNGEDKELSIEDKGERFPYPLQDTFSISLFSPVSCEIIPNTKIDLEEWEHVNCLEYVSLAHEGTVSGLKGYVAIGTNYNYGEDITSRGRILIYDIIEVVPEPGQPLTKNRLKEIYAKEQKGPITAISHVTGFLVSAVDQKIYIWQLKDNDLVAVAFIDAQIYTHQIITIKNLILIADVYKSISLLRFQEQYRTLSLVSRDFRPSEVSTVEYLIDNTNLGFLCSDNEKNLALYMHQPEARESCGGYRLGLLQIKIFLVTFLSNYNFTINSKVKLPATLSKSSMAVSLENPLYLNIEKI